MLKFLERVNKWVVLGMLALIIVFAGILFQKTFSGSKILRKITNIGTPKSAPNISSPNLKSFPPIDLRILPSNTTLINNKVQIRVILKRLSSLTPVDFEFNWGDGSSVLVKPGTDLEGGIGLLVEHFWRNIGVYTIKVRASSLKYNDIEKTAKITVTRLEILQEQSAVKVGRPYNLVFQIKNLPPSSKLNFSVSWGDGRTDNFDNNSTNASGVNKVSATHIYSIFGNFSPSIQLSDTILTPQNIILPGIIVTSQ